MYVCLSLAPLMLVFSFYEVRIDHLGTIGGVVYKMLTAPFVFPFIYMQLHAKRLFSDAIAYLNVDVAVEGMIACGTVQ